MDSAFKLPVHITYRQPSWLPIALMISHIGAIICIFTVPVPSWLTVVLSTMVLAGLLWSLSVYLRYRYLLPPRRLILNAGDEWKLVDERGARNITLLPGAFVHPRLLVLRFTDNSRGYSFILTPTTVEGNTLRRLRVRLRFVM